MERREAMLWLTTIARAEKGDTEAQEMVQAENEQRAQENMPTLQEELKAMMRK